ncbi:hypothetical protein E4U22_003748 [Claviceps purpurea]|nr:hypothetical protein E4U22_003748 [Claviceps purpurea]
MWRCTGLNACRLCGSWNALTVTHSFCKTGVPTRLRLRQLFYPSSISFHQNSKASVSAQLAVKLIDFSCFSRSTSQ